MSLSFLYEPKPFTKESRQRAVNDLLANTRYDRDYYILLLGAILLALGAIFMDSMVVLIASMIVAPLAYPILALGLGIAARDLRLIGRSIGVLLFSVAIALGLSIGLTVLFGGERVANKYISFTGNGEIAMAIAVVAGAIAAYGLMHSRVAGAITGVAIAVSLMPPLVASGVGVIADDSGLAYSAFTLFLLNIVGILLASAVVFTVAGVGRAYRSRAKR